MNKTIKTLWLEALRSGKYKQTKYMLKKTDNDKESYCCLGVLCDIYARTHEDAKWTEVGRIFDGVDVGINLPTPAVRDWAGLENANPVVTVAKNQTSLANLNDKLNKSFKQIANIIEKHL